MPRRNRRQRPTPRPLPRDGSAFIGSLTVEGPRWSFGQPYVMRYVGAASATKYYVCPGCNQNIPPGVAHVVAWPRDTGGQTADRRHWHRHCWERR